MMKSCGALRLTCALVWTACGLAAFAGAQTASTGLVSKQTAAHRKGTGTLKLVVILSRHGVRSSTWTPARLNSYSAQQWPDWKVQPGYLTERGFELVKRFGSYDRVSLAEAGLLASRGCEDVAATYIWADTDERTMESGRALAEGMFPGCAPPVHGLAQGVHDALFHPAKGKVNAADADAAFAEVSSRVSAKIDPDQDKLIAEMRNVLLACAPSAACSPAQKPAKMLAAGGVTAVRGTGDHLVELEGPLAESSSFAEDFLLEYGDGMAADKVGWGNVNEPQIRRFLALHTDYFDLIHRTPTLARIESSNMLLHLVSTLQQRADGRTVPDAVGPKDSKLVVLVGHDGNLAGVAALLGLHWTLDGRRDDTPPGMELAFELWQSDQGQWLVRVRASMQTLGQMRNLEELTPAAPPASEVLQVEGCGNVAGTCSWKEFQRIALMGIGKGASVAAPSK